MKGYIEVFDDLTGEMKEFLMQELRRDINKMHDALIKHKETILSEDELMQVLIFCSEQVRVKLKLLGAKRFSLSVSWTEE